MKDFSSISDEILEGIHIEENPSNNERNPGMKDFLQFLMKFLEGFI